MILTFYKLAKINDKIVNGKVVDLTFAQLVYNLQFPVEVDVTIEEIFRLSDSDKPEDQEQYKRYKDTGYFIAGEVNVASKSRKAENVLNRTVLTFDVDYPTENVWAKLLTLYPKTQAIYYTTIRSSLDKPRYRILIPLNRPVGSADYAKLMAFFMDKLGKSNFDKTTADFARVMYFPAVCKDQTYGFDHNGTEPLNVDEILSQVEESFEDIVKKNRSKTIATPPKEKKGVVGAFNRAFSITRTIEAFLSDFYKVGYNSTPDTPRYKYYKSKGAPGGRVYDNDTMFYSTHDHDPVSGKNLDSFNLVKEHLFSGDYDKMKEWALKLPEVIEEMQVNSELEDTDEEWINHLARDPKKGTLLATPYNIQMIMLNDPNLAGMFRTNTLTYMIEVCKDMEIIGGASNRKFKTLEDADIIEVQIYIETSKFAIRASKQLIIDIVCQVARLNKYDPVQDYLESVQDAWDGVPRIETMFQDYLMVKDTPIVRAIARKVMAACIWRIMKPGIKWEGVPVLRGIQGCGKSTFIQKLYKSSMYDAEPKNWINNTNIDYSNIDKAIQRTKGFWGIELAELANTTMSNYSNELMKSFISMDRPVTRIPYDKFEITIDRKCVFWGTTNVWLYISDQTGARRFLPIDCEAYTEEDKHTCLMKINAMPVDQLWAEAMTYYKDEKLYFTPSQEKELNAMRLLHTEESSYEAILSRFINSKITVDWETKTPRERADAFTNGGCQGREYVINRTTITMSEFVYEALGKGLDTIPRKQIREIELTFFNLGWQVAPYPIKTVYGQSKTFIRIGKTTNEKVVEDINMEDMF